MPPPESSSPANANRTPVAWRFFRFLRLGLHVAHGLVIAWLRYPRLTEAERHAEKRRWSKKLLSICSVSVREIDAPEKLAGRCMLVTNHISWLDIFVVDAVLPASFVAKSEIRDWPLVGWLCTRAGTLYIERGKPSAAARARRAVSSELERGALIAVCPEGTTTFGRTLERFHSALFQPAIDAGAVLQPVALRYRDPGGEHTDAAGYVGETSLLESVWTILSARCMVAELRFLAPIPAAGQGRRSLAERAELAISSALGATRVGRRHPRREPDTGAGLPDEPR